MTTGDDDHAAVRRALAGDHGAFEDLFRRHARTVFGIAQRIAGPGDAEALTVDVFSRAWRKLATFRFEGAFSSWLRRLARNAIANHVRALAGVRGAATGEPAARDSAVELRFDLDAAIARLPAGARAVFVLHDVEGCTHDEIARLLGIRSGTSKSQLARARRLLRDALAERSER